MLWSKVATAKTAWPQGFPPGFQVKFAPERMLGRGSFGSVWLARQLPLDRRVALKVLHEDVLENEAETGRFMDEARITASLAHPHVVVVLDHGVESGIPWIAYEYLEGQSLRKKIPEDGMPWRDAVAAIVQVADALEFAHGKGVLHRDIKPDNVIEVQPGHYKVADFGLAKLAQQKHAWTRAGSVVGSPAYLSPEQIEGLDPTPASDQYALGITLHELLVGKLPFTEQPEMPVMMAHLKLAPPRASELRPAVPKVFDLLLERMLAKKPEERFADAHEVRVALEAIRGGESSQVMVRMRSRGRRTDQTPRARVTAERPVAVPPAPAAARKRPGPVWWAMAVLLPLLVGAYLGAGRVRHDDTSASPTPAAPSPGAGFRRLAVAPQPPRSVRVEYELDRLPAAGVTLPVQVDGEERAPVKLTSVEGSLVVTAVAPGAHVRVGHAAPVVTPRGLAAWMDALAADRAAVISVRMLEVASLELTIFEQPAGTIVVKRRTARGHRALERITGLKPLTRYTARLRSAEPDRYLAPDAAEVTFTTLAPEAADAARRELAFLRSPDEQARVRAAAAAPLVLDPEEVQLATGALAGRKLAADYDAASHLLQTLTRAHDPRALPGLESMLAAAPDVHARVTALERLADIQDPSGFALAERECARPGLPDEEEAVQAAAAALVASDPARARSLFLKASNEPATAPEALRRAALEGLAQLGGDEAAAALGRLARFAPAELGPRAANALGALGGEAARGELLALVSGARPGEAGPATEAALRALSRCGRSEDAPRVAALLKAPLGSRLKRAALTTLAGLGGPVAATEVASRVEDPDDAVALAAAWAAGQLRAKAAAPGLIRRLARLTPASDAADARASRVVRALAQIGDPAAIPALRLLAVAPHAGPAALVAHADALWALGVLGAQDAFAEILAASRAGDVYTRIRAVEALGWLDDARALPSLDVLAADPALWAPVREAARTSLRWIKEGKRQRGLPFVVDPGFPPVRTGLALVIGETFTCEAQGLCFLDPAALSAEPDPANPPPGTRPAKQALVGMVAATGQCFVGRGETAPCASNAEGELVLYAIKPDPDDRAAGFFTAWVSR